MLFESVPELDVSIQNIISMPRAGQIGAVPLSNIVSISRPTGEWKPLIIDVS